MLRPRRIQPPLLPLLLLLLLLPLLTSSFFLLRSPKNALSLSRSRTTLFSSSPATNFNIREYILPDPTEDDEDLRDFICPSTITTPLPLPEAVQVYGAFNSMSKARKLIRKGRVFVNQEPKDCRDTAMAGDRIEVRPSVSSAGKTSQRKDGKSSRSVKKVIILFEDDDIAIIIKPAGVAVHGTGLYSLVDQYAEFLTPTTRDEEEALAKPVHAHRLDAPVGGLLIVAKTKTALRNLSLAFEEKRIHKKYHAVVIGTPAQTQGLVTEPVDGKEARTRYEVVETTPSLAYGHLTRIDLYPETGRKHQLRQHCAFEAGLGCPILGDIRYGPDNTLRTRGLFLWSVGVELTHPVSGEALVFATPLPEIYGNTLNMERRKVEQRQAEEEK